MKLVGRAIAAVLAGAVAGAGGAGVILGPQGEFHTFIGRLEYDPSTACNKPARPYSPDRAAQAAYIERAKRYLECMADAADADTKYANDVIADGLKEQSDDFVSEVERGN